MKPASVNRARRFCLALLVALGWQLVLGSGPAPATVQVPDNLIYQGERYNLLTFPLSPYLKEKFPRYPFKMYHTANYRGYTATWEIDKNTLFLKSFGGNLDGKRVGLDFLFPQQKGPVPATWFSGDLRAGQGQPRHGPYRKMIYERELIFTIDQGKVVGKKIVENSTLPGQPQK